MSIRVVLGIMIGAMISLLVIGIIKSRVINTTVLIQEGHVGRTKGNIGSVYNGLKEVTWNGIVGKEVERLLKIEGIAVERVGAKIPVTNTTIAIAIHFDGSNNHCATGASIGHNGSYGSKQMAKHWREQYAAFYPFKWHKENFTRNLSHYYGFSHVNATKGFLVLELGELTCRKQTDWLKPRLKQVASQIAHFIIKELKE